MNEQICDYLEYYIDLPEPPQFAVMITGDWGSGKSFFVKNFLKTHSKVEYIYISLYGVNSTSEILDQIFEQVHPILASKGVKIARKIGAALLKATVKIDVGPGGHLDLSSGSPKLDLSEFIKADDRLLVIDDLERAAMDIVSLLGYINQFVESNGNKVILISNEKEIEGASPIRDDTKNETKTKPSPSNKYLRTKEKLIGKTFLLETDVEQAATAFFKSITGKAFKDYIETDREKILATYKDAGYNNLRHLKQTILDLDRFFELLPQKAFRNVKLIDDFVRTFIALAFELRAGRKTDEILKFYEGSSIDAEKGTLRYTLNEKYGISSVPITHLMWYEFFSIGTFRNPTELSKWIVQSKYFPDENTPDEIKLWRWWDLEDHTFVRLLDIVSKQLSDSSIDDQGLLSHIVSILMSLSHEELYNVPKDDILQLAKKNVDRLKESRKLFKDAHLNITFSQYLGLGYNARELPEFIEYFGYLTKSITGSLPYLYETESNTLMSTFETNPHLFAQQIIIGNQAQNKYFDKPVLAGIDATTFVNRYMRLTNSDKGIINDCLGSRYKHLQLLRDLLPELPWLETVKALLAQKVATLGRTVSAKHFSAADTIIADAIRNLKAVVVIPDANA